MKSKREIFVKVKENNQLRGVVPVYDAQGTVKFDDEIGEKIRFETKTILEHKAPMKRSLLVLALPLLAGGFVFALAWLIRSWIIVPVVSARPETKELWQQAELGFVMLVIVAALIAGLAVLMALIYQQGPLRELAERIALSGMAEQPVALPSSGNAATAVIVKRYNDLVGAVQRSSQALQERVVESEGLSSQILARVPSGILATGADGILLRINAVAESILHLQAEDIVGEDINKILAAEHPLLEALQHEEHRAEATIKIGGEERIVGISSAKIPGSGEQKNLGGVVVFSDLTEMYALRESLEMKERLASLGELAAGLAHELRNPLAALRGFVELLEGRIEQAERAKKLLSQITRESDSLAAVVGDFLAFARVSPPQWQQLDTHNLLSDALAAGLSASAAQRQTSIQIASEAKELMGDQGQLHRALVNFVINACQATEAQGRIVLTANLMEQHIVLSVEDDGPGIEAALLGRLPTPFLTTKANGTGLGLAVCHQIAQAHGGHLEISSSEWGGAQVSLHLPDASAERRDNPLQKPFSSKGDILNDNS